MSVLTYPALVALALCAGRGLVALLRSRVAPSRAWLLGPPTLLAAWTVALGLLAHARIPLASCAAPLWGATALLALLGLRQARRDLGRGLLGVLVLCAGLPVLLLAPHFAAGLADYAGVFFGDGWGYVADAQYLWGWSEARPPSALHAWATALTGTRHATATLLAALSPLEQAGDPQRVVGLFCALLLFVYACACASLPLPRGLRVPLLLMAVPAGWVGQTLAFSNYDQALALSLLPAVWGACARASVRSALLAGALLAGLLFAFPEQAPVFLASHALGAVLLARRARRAREPLLAASASLGVALALVGPCVPQLVRFVSWQVPTLHAGRPGGGRFAGLLDPQRWPAALLGLGGEDVARWPSVPWPSAALACLLTALALLGGRQCWRTRQRPLLGVAGAYAGASAALLARDYHYGAYKFLSLSYWCFALLALLGAAALGSRLGASRRQAVWALALATLLQMAWTPGLHRLRAADAADGLDLGRLRALAHSLGGLRPRGLALDVRDPAAQQWAVYFLRALPLRIYDDRGYLANREARLRLAAAERPAWRQVDYLVTDEPPAARVASHAAELVLEQAPLRVWRLRSGLTWLSSSRPEPGRLELGFHLRRAGAVRLSLRASAGMRVRARSEASVLETLATEGRLELRLALPEGPSLIRLDAEDGPVPATLQLLRAELDPEEPCASSTRPPRAPALPHAGPIVPRPEAGLRPVGSADFDGDGVADAVFQDVRHGQARVWLLDGPGPARLRAEIEFAPRPAARRARLAAVADLNADGLADLAWQDDATSEVEFQLSCGGELSGWARPDPPRPIGPSWRLVSAGDLDGDDVPDLLFSHPRDQRATAWYMDGALHRVQEALLEPPDERGGWRVMAIAPRQGLDPGHVRTEWQGPDGRRTLLVSSKAGR